MSDTFKPGDRVQGRRSGRLGTVCGPLTGGMVPTRWDAEPGRVAHMSPNVLYHLPAPPPSALDRTKVQGAYRALQRAIDAHLNRKPHTSFSYMLQARAFLEEADA